VAELDAQRRRAHTNRRPRLARRKRHRRPLRRPAQPATPRRPAVTHRSTRRCHKTLYTDEITALLAVAAGYDNRRPGDLNTAAWHDASHRGRWTFEEAVEAVKEHYANEVAFVMPAHVTAIIKRHRDRARQDELTRQLIENPYNIKSFRGLWQDKIGESKPQSEYQRAVVLHYPDLAGKLTEPPISCRRAQEWNGWVPPLLDADGRPNDSRRAAALRALVEEAENRARQAAS
jgi:hypothetical protein